MFVYSPQRVVNEMHISLSVPSICGAVEYTYLDISPSLYIVDISYVPLSFSLSLSIRLTITLIRTHTQITLGDWIFVSSVDGKMIA